MSWINTPSRDQQIDRVLAALDLQPVSTPTVSSCPVTKPLNGHVIEAVRCTVSDDESDYVKAYYAGRWLVVERDPAANLIRESTASYANERAAYYAYWHATEDEPLDFEAWVAPLWATATPPKIVTSHIYPPIPDRSNDWCAYYDGEEERGDYGYGPTEQAAIDDLIANYEAA